MTYHITLTDRTTRTYNTNLGFIVDIRAEVPFIRVFRETSIVDIRTKEGEKAAALIALIPFESVFLIELKDSQSLVVAAPNDIPPTMNDTPAPTVN